MVDYKSMKKDELMNLAKAAKVRGRGRMTKLELAKALAALSAPAGGPPPASASAPAPTKKAAERKAPPVPRDAELPSELGENRACLLPQNPRTAFLYWEVQPDRIDQVLRECGLDNGRLLMRVYEWDGSARLLQSEYVGDRVGSWYIHLDRSGLDIWAEIGIEVAGRYVVLLSTNRLRLPRDTPSEELDGLWMTRRRHLEEIFRLSGGAHGPGSSAEGPPRPLPWRSEDVTSWQGGGKGRSK